MEVYKINEYKVVEKGKEYSVLVFPVMKYMWAYDGRPEEDCYMIDGTACAFKQLKLACVILISFPNLSDNLYIYDVEEKKVKIS